MKFELLAPAGDFSKLKTALYFGADAVYVGGKQFSLRALAGNFTDEALAEAVGYTHRCGKKIYVTVNIFAKNGDLAAAERYFAFLESVGADAAIVSDPGLIFLAQNCAPRLPIHLSTQANTTNRLSAEFWAKTGVKRVVLAREFSCGEIAEIHRHQPQLELEAFIHGAMCVSYSGRCLLSNYLSGRDGNRGACVQACRWKYEIRESGTDGAFLPIEEDGRGTYLLNSKDLNLIDYLPELAGAGVVSFKIEGRMKSEYYLATVVNAYRRAIDRFKRAGAEYRSDPLFREELKKTAHRDFTTAYFLGGNDSTINYENSQSAGTHRFTALVLSYDRERRRALVEMRNRFVCGDELEVLSPNDGSFNRHIRVNRLENEDGAPVTDAKRVQEKLWLYTDLPLACGDILRKREQA